MKQRFFQFILLISFALLFSSVNAGYKNRIIDVSVISDFGGYLDKYPVSSSYKKEKAYIAAKKGHSYSIKIRNKTANRLAVVIAVDGRNIISGKKSYLASHEKMYILDPFESATYKGWRTARNQVNRFYFSRTKHSYASSFGDHSAMGVIAVAAFKEKHRQYRKNKQKRSNKPRHRRHSNQAGTGFGEEEYSPSIKVHFKAQSHAAYKSLLKYEWKRVLCKKGIISCHKHKPHNRLWDEDEDEYAPYPATWNRTQRSPFFSLLD